MLKDKTVYDAMERASNTCGYGHACERVAGIFRRERSLTMIKDLIKKLIYVYVKIVLKPVQFIFKIRSGNGMSSMALTVCQTLENKSEYVSYQIKPKNTAEIPILEGLDQSHSFAIVMQGPLCKKDDMTINTILFYKKTYPFAKIIVSTWNDEAKEDLNKITKLGAIVVTSDKPSDSGFLNVNMQLVNSLAGVKKAKEIGCEFAVKTRTDQRVCKPFIFDTMISAIKLFPSSSGQKGRIVTLGAGGGGMFTLYFSCDFLYLGYTDDLINVFSAPLDNRDYKEIPTNIGIKKSRRENSEMMYPPEIYILKHYCKDILKLSGEDTVKEYWNVTKNYLICYGMNDVDLMWNKYNKLYDLNHYSSAYYGSKDSPKRLSTMCFDFFNWLNLYTGKIQYDKSYEQYADVTLAIENEKKKNN